MIVFLTLIYVAVLVLLIKLRVIRLTLWWKISPLVWMLLLLIFLFIPMQWGAPSGVVNMYQEVVQITPEVSGEVIDVPVKALQPVARGDVLFRIDPKPYEYKVAGLEAKLKLAQLNLVRAKKLKTTDFAAQVVFAKRQQRLGGRLEQQVQQRTAVSFAGQDEPIQLVRQRKDVVKVLYRQKFRLPG